MMISDMDNLKIISVYSGTAMNKSKMRKRKYNAFILRTSGKKFFDFGDKTFTVSKGEVIFIPKGATYESKNISNEECRYTCIAFDADSSENEPSVYSLEDFPEGFHIFNHLSSYWDSPSKPEKYKCLSMFYSLLSYMSTIENPDYPHKSKRELIRPALDYLDANIFNPLLRCDNLHHLCNMSDTYFRKIFIASFGVSPQKYIINRRISKAKSFLENGTEHSIAEVASIVGFNDPLYFSRAFKKVYGIPPSFISKDV